jgi:hypothetical protein
MAYQDLSAIAHGASQEKSLEEIKERHLINDKIAASFARVQPAFHQITIDQQKLVIHGTIDKSLHAMFREIGKDTSRLEFYFELTTDGKTEIIEPNDPNRVFNAKDVRDFERLVQQPVEYALNEFLRGAPLQRKARIKKAILDRATRQVTRILLNERITNDNVNSIELKIRKP